MHKTLVVIGATLLILSAPYVKATDDAADKPEICQHVSVDTVMDITRCLDDELWSMVGLGRWMQFLVDGSPAMLTLPGTKGVTVDVSSDDEGLLTTERLRTKVELVLRRNKVPILNDDSSVAPTLRILVSFLPNEATGTTVWVTNNLAHSEGLTIGLDRYARMLLLWAGNHAYGLAPTADAPRAALDAVEADVERFCNAYLEANSP